MESWLLLRKMVVRLGWLLPILAILVAGITTWNWGKSRDLLPCTKDCGEVFVTLHQAKNFSYYGLKYGLIEDHATSSNVDSHPALYTHNVNIGSLYYVFLEAIGVEDYGGKQTATFLIYLFVLVYGAFAAWRLTGSFFFGGVFVVFFASDFEQVISFSFNSLRVWSWLPLFGLAAHFVPLVRGEAKWPVLEWTCVLLFSFIAFGIGYEFHVINFCIAVFLLGAFGRIGTKEGAKTLIGLVAAFAVAPILRQIQVMSMMGMSFWVKDLHLSAAIKVPFLNLLLPIPSIEEIDRYYIDLGIVRPFAMPASSIGDLVDFALGAFSHILLPANGLGALIVFLCVTVLSLTATFLERRRMMVFGARAIGVVQAGRWFIALIFGMGVGILIFMPMSLHVYLKHQFPLVGLPFLLAKAIFVWWLLGTMLDPWRQKIYKFAVGIIVLGIFADHVIVNHGNASRAPTVPMGWIQDVLREPNANYAVSWIPNTVASFVDGWVVGVQPSRGREIAARLERKDNPFRYDDFYLFHQRDAEEDQGRYLNPDYWLYFPLNDVFHYDSAQPVCRRDYLTRALAKIVRIGFPPESVSPWIYRSGNTVALGTGVVEEAESVDVIEVLEPIITTDFMNLEEAIARFGSSLNRPSLTMMSYDCRYKQASATIELQPEWYRSTPVYAHFPIRVTYREKQTFIIQVIAQDMRRDAPYIPEKPLIMKERQLTAKELARSIPDVPVHASGEGYVIFDLREAFDLHRLTEENVAKATVTVKPLL